MPDSVGFVRDTEPFRRELLAPAPDAMVIGGSPGEHEVTAEDAMANLARYASFRGMILQLDEV